jgi:hypothetical protein
MTGMSMAKPPPNPAAMLPVIKPAARILWFAPSIESCCCPSESGERSARLLAAQERDQQCWPEKIADVLDGIPRG